MAEHNNGIDDPLFISYGALHMPPQKKAIAYYYQLNLYSRKK